MPGAVLLVRHVADVRLRHADIPAGQPVDRARDEQDEENFAKASITNPTSDPKMLRRRIGRRPYRSERRRESARR